MTISKRERGLTTRSRFYTAYRAVREVNMSDEDKRWPSDELEDDVDVVAHEIAIAATFGDVGVAALKLFHAGTSFPRLPSRFYIGRKRREKIEAEYHI